ncbi:hypothetical protein MTBBW1_730018 [Desulfamplus magnetovallimortis]|uniref:Uncharacterized protein n=1 Tax=Desulfamplus magnetovallimortis TaxID=1246637 RepID=A0A1W1HJ77_9BACT|nr:hypothetical protein MTBBW1_730018 [Desulfamplus magnetovallimortis]
MSILSLITYMADYRHNRRDESRFKNSQLLRLSYKRTWLMTATIEELKVFIKTPICGDFHIKISVSHTNFYISQYKNQYSQCQRKNISLITPLKEFDICGILLVRYQNI